MLDYINDYPDFPKKGIIFKDICPLLKSPEGWAKAITQLGYICEELNPDYIVGIESRGFIVGTALATTQKIGFIPIRKSGKLPGKVNKQHYTLEYGTDTLEIQSGVFDKQSRVLIVDDLLATGGTVEAASKLVRKSGGNIVGYGFIIELNELNGRDKINDNIPVRSLIRYD